MINYLRKGICRQVAIQIATMYLKMEDVYIVIGMEAEVNI